MSSNNSKSLIFARAITHNKLERSMKDRETDFSVIADYYKKHYEEVQLFVAKQLKQRGQEAEDIVQNVFLRLMTMGRMITPVTLPCLVYTMVRNLICDDWRHHQCITEYEHYIKGGQDGLDCDPMSVYSAAETLEILERGITRLTAKQRQVYRLHIYKGMKVGEISKALDMRYKSTEHRLGTARREVRAFVKRALA